MAVAVMTKRGGNSSRMPRALRARVEALLLENYAYMDSPVFRQRGIEKQLFTFDIEPEQERSSIAHHARRAHALQADRAGDVAVELSNRAGADARLGREPARRRVARAARALALPVPLRDRGPHRPSIE